MSISLRSKLRQFSQLPSVIDDRSILEPGAQCVNILMEMLSKRNFFLPFSSHRFSPNLFRTFFSYFRTKRKAHALLTVGTNRDGSLSEGSHYYTGSATTTLLD